MGTMEHSRRSCPAEPVHIPPFDGIRNILKGGGNPRNALTDSGQQFAGCRDRT